MENPQKAVQAADTAWAEAAAADAENPNRRKTAMHRPWLGIMSKRADRLKKKQTLLQG